ncbi:adenosylcobinamide-phosphate synthase CbiB [Jannaschia seosinensis]|nr:adenosylcobinamide-phosphate synthase CbiB [Jannaschia seosinensis]
MILDAVFGEPDAVWSRIPHPAILMGRAVGWCDARFNRGSFRRMKGVLSIIGLGALAWLIGLAVSAIPDAGLLEAIVAAVLLAQRSLVDHVRAVATGLRSSLRDGRTAVGMIVGRDTTAMTKPEIARAAIESAAENLSDGVIAPAFWFAVAGLPGMALYKMVNTADSMIGYRTPRHAAFGWAAARLDDVLNWVPARLTALLILGAHGAFGLWRRVPEDARLHRSPNAGWPEAAMAPLLGIALSGPRSYEGRRQVFPWVNAHGRRDAGPADVERAVGVLWRSWGAALILAVVAGFGTLWAGG